MHEWHLKRTSSQESPTALTAVSSQWIQEPDSSKGPEATPFLLGLMDRLEKDKALIPAEQARVVQLLVAHITVSEAGLAIDLRHDGLGAIAALMAPPKKEVA